MPQELIEGGNATDQNLNPGGTGQELSSSSPSPSSPPSPAPSSPASELGSAGQGAAGTPPAGMSVRDFLRGQGLDLSHLQDDHAALAHLTLAYRQAQEAQRWQPYAQQYAQHAPQFQAWLQQQQAAAQQAQGQPKASWWKAPEFDPAWRHQLRNDPVTNRLVPVEGAPADLAEKYYAYIQHQQKFFDKFAMNPIEAIQPGIEEVAQRIAQQVVNQHLSQYQNHNHARQVLTENAEWLYQRDQAGNYVYGPSYAQTGMPELSQAGRIYRNHVVTLEQSGMRDQAAVAQFAKALTERDVLLARASQNGAAQQQQQANQQFLAAHNRPNVSGSLPNGTQHHNPDAAPTQNGRLRLDEMLRQRFNQRGITDATIMAELQS